MYGSRKVRYSPNLQEIVRGDRNNHPPEMVAKVTDCNTDYWRFIINTNDNFRWTSEKTPTDQEAYIRQLIIGGNFLCLQPRVQGVMTGLS